MIIVGGDFASVDFVSLASEAPTARGLVFVFSQHAEPSTIEKAALAELLENEKFKVAVLEHAVLLEKPCFKTNNISLKNYLALDRAAKNLSYQNHDGKITSGLKCYQRMRLRRG